VASFYSEPCRSFPEFRLLTRDNDGDNGFTVADVIFLLQVLSGQREDIHYPPSGGSFSVTAECVDGHTMGIAVISTSTDDAPIGHQ